MTTTVPESLWTAKDVAAYLKVSRSLVYKLAENATLPSLTIGACRRFEPEVVQRFARGEIRGEPQGRVVEINQAGHPTRVLRGAPWAR
jgi:excisionase family DNA binding protein